MTLQELKALCERATPGRWEPYTAVWHNPFGADELRGACAHEYEPDEYIGKARYPVSAQADKDASFIAAARTALPELIRRLELAEEALRVACDCPNSGFACVVCMAYETIRKDLP